MRAEAAGSTDDEACGPRRGRGVLLAVLLLVGLASGLCLEPDSGTAASLATTDLTGAVLGPNHPKPLPRLPVPADLLRVAIPAVLLAVLALHHAAWAGAVPVEREAPPPRTPLRSSTHALRGPPAVG